MTYKKLHPINLQITGSQPVYKIEKNTWFMVVDVDKNLPPAANQKIISVGNEHSRMHSDGEISIVFHNEYKAPSSFLVEVFQISKDKALAIAEEFTHNRMIRFGFPEHAFTYHYDHIQIQS